MVYQITTVGHAPVRERDHVDELARHDHLDRSGQGTFPYSLRGALI